MLILHAFVLAVTLLLAVPVLWFCTQVFAACATPGRTKFEFNSSEVANIAVLIPAHNESVNLIPTLRCVFQQNLPNLRVLLVADNCSDDTASIAKNEGAEVIERHHGTLRGKGYALDFGVQHLSVNPPSVLIILDADCLLEPGVLKKLGDTVLGTRRPVQALYLMKNTGNPTVKSKIAEFAWLVKNWVRPRGLHAMGLTCQLTGSGMAFPWKVIQQVPLATGEIVEDMKLGLTLTAMGHPPVFCENAIVSSVFPSQEEGVRSQRTRWEHGHLSMMMKEGLPKLLEGLRKRDAQLFFLALDVCIPPLALLVMSTIALQVPGIFYWLFTSNPLPFIVGTACLLFTTTAVLMAWSQYGRSVISANQLLMIPVYMASKIPIYVRYLFQRQAEWVRSKRDNESK